MHSVILPHLSVILDKIWRRTLIKKGLLAVVIFIGSWNASTAFGCDNNQDEDQYDPYAQYPKGGYHYDQIAVRQKEVSEVIANGKYLESLCLLHEMFFSRLEDRLTDFISDYQMPHNLTVLAISVWKRENRRKLKKITEEIEQWSMKYQGIRSSMKTHSKNVVYLSKPDHLRVLAESGYELFENYDDELRASRRR